MWGRPVNQSTSLPGLSLSSATVSKFGSQGKKFAFRNGVCRCQSGGKKHDNHILCISSHSNEVVRLKTKSSIKKFHNSHSFLIVTKTNFQSSNHYFNSVISRSNMYNLFVAYINDIILYLYR